MPCTSGCRTQDHESYSACLKDKGVRIPAIPVEAIASERAGSRNLDDYANARKYGIQPKSTRPHDVRFATQISEKTGEAYVA